MRVCMFVKNSLEYDERVRREAATLTEAGHDVVVLALLVPGVTPAIEYLGQVRVQRVAKPRLGFEHVASLYARLRGPDEIGDLVGPSTATPGSAGQRSGQTTLHPHASAGRPTRAAAALLRLLVAVARVVAGRPVRVLTDRLLDQRLVRQALHVDADVYHAHDLNTLRAAVQASRTRSATVVYDSHELHGDRNRANVLQRGWARRVERRLLREVDAVLVASPGYARVLRDRYGLEEPVVLRNVPRARSTPQPRDLRAELRLPADERIVLYQGSIQENRGIEQTIDALAELQDVTFVVVGYGHHRPAIQRHAALRGATDRVRFLGPFDYETLLSYTAGADIGMCCILPRSRSYELSLPNKLFEYVVCGVPIVGSNLAEIAAFIRGEEVGEVCDPTDPHSIAVAVNHLLGDPDRLRRARANALDAATRHVWDTEQRALVDLYGRLAAAHSGR